VQLRVHQLAEAGRVAGQEVADRLRRQHGARPDPAHLQAAAGEQLAQLLGAVAAGDGAVWPRDEHHVGVGHVDQVRPAVLLGEHGHPEGQRVDAGEHLPAGPEHARDLGDQLLGGQPQGQRPLLGDHAVGAAVRQELEAGAVGGHGGQATAGRGARQRRRRRRLRVDHPQNAVPGGGGYLGGARAGTRDVDEEPPSAW
jgi:hypothetical protein